MQLSARMRYATRAVVELAMADGHCPVALKSVAESQRIPAKYLEQIMGSLRAAGLVRSERGPAGGYMLARPPADVRLWDVYRALEGPLAPVHCSDDPASCPMRAVCPTSETWAEVREAVKGIFERTTVQHLVDRRRARESAIAPTYSI